MDQQITDSEYDAIEAVEKVWREAYHKALDDVLEGLGTYVDYEPVREFILEVLKPQVRERI